MTEQNTKLLHNEQKSIRPKIENAAVEILDTKEQQHLLNFVAWLRKKKLSPSWSRVHLGSHSKSYTIGFKGVKICIVNLVFDGQYAGSWNVAFAAHNFDESIVLSDENLNKAVWDNIVSCQNCDNCKPGRRMTVCGKIFDRVCMSFLTFKNPKAEKIECIKQILEININLIQSGNRVVNVTGAPNPKYPEGKQSVTKIEDYIPGCLDGSMKKASLDFIDHLYKNKITPKLKLLNWWEVKYKGILCKIRLPYHFQRCYFSWAVGIYLENMDNYRNEIKIEGLQDIVWDNLILCKGCSPKCAPGNNITVLGKSIKGICINCPPSPLWVYDPDETAVDYIKKLLELEKKARD